MARTGTTAVPFPDGAADVARRFGVTVKTLRLYEAAGLIRPVRDARGWRTYGQVECERLHLVLLLRRFGLPLARIGEMLSSGRPDLASVLELQAKALTEQRDRIDAALALIGQARRHLAGGGDLDPATLADLARAQPTRLRWTPALDGIAAQCFSTDQQERLANVAPALEAEWAAVYHELAAIGHGSPASPQALRLGTRAASLIERMTGGDAALRDALVRFWRTGFADPAVSPTLPLDEAGWRFLGEAMRQAATAIGDGR